MNCAAATALYGDLHHHHRDLITGEETTMTSFNNAGGCFGGAGNGDGDGHFEPRTTAPLAVTDEWQVNDNAMMMKNASTSADIAQPPLPYMMQPPFTMITNGRGAYTTTDYYGGSAGTSNISDLTSEHSHPTPSSTSSSRNHLTDNVFSGGGVSSSGGAYAPFFCGYEPSSSMESHQQRWLNHSLGFGGSASGTIPVSISHNLAAMSLFDTGAALPSAAYAFNSFLADKSSSMMAANAALNPYSAASCYGMPISMMPPYGGLSSFPMEDAMAKINRLNAMVASSSASQPFDSDVEYPCVSSTSTLKLPKPLPSVGVNGAPVSECGSIFECATMPPTTGSAVDFPASSPHNFAGLSETNRLDTLKNGMPFRPASSATQSQIGNRNNSNNNKNVRVKREDAGREDRNNNNNNNNDNNLSLFAAFGAAMVGGGSCGGGGDASFPLRTMVNSFQQRPTPYKTGPGSNHVRVRTQDKYRTVYEAWKRDRLEVEFAMHNFITAERKAELSTVLNLTERQVKIWFQNRVSMNARNGLTNVANNVTAIRWLKFFKIGLTTLTTGNEAAGSTTGSAVPPPPSTVTRNDNNNNNKPPAKPAPTTMLQGAKLRLIVLLTLLLIAILLASAILLLLNGGGSSSGEESGAGNQSHSANDLKGPFGEVSAKATTPSDGVSSEGAKMTKGTTTAVAAPRATRPTTPPPPLKEIVMPRVAVQFATECGVEMTAAERNAQCPGSVKMSRDYAANALPEVFNVTRAVEYTLNVTVADKADRKMSGSIDYLVEIQRETGGVLLHAGRHILFVDENAIHAWRCGGGDDVDNDAEGSRPICIESVSRVPDRELLFVKFAEMVPRGALVRLRLARFEADLTPSNPGLILQHPSSWERDRAWMVGTLNAGRAITSVFPILSMGNGVEKATFRVCIRHPRDVIARSNMPLQSGTTDDEEKLTLSCFHDTAAIPVQHFAFVLFDNLRAVGVTGAEIAAAATAIVGTAVEVFVGKHLSAADSRWINEETEQALSKMESALGVHFPLDKLTIVSSPLSALDGTAALGLIHVRETWVEYPKYFHTHSVLVGQLARQWLSNVVTFCDKCFEDGVVTYFEWTISAELSNRMSNDGDGSANLTQRFGELHARLMNGGAAAVGATTAGGMPAAMLPPVAFGGVKPAVECANRVTATLHMLANFYGVSAVHKFLSAVVRQHSWRECVSRAELSTHFRDAVGGHSGQTAQQIFDTFFTDASSVVGVAPLVRIHLRNGVLTLRQVPAATATSASSPTRTIPVEIVDDARRHTQFVIGSAAPTVDADRGAAKFVVAVPNGYVRHIYNVENYERLADCFTTSCASASTETIYTAFGDLCHVLLNDRLPASNASSVGSGDDTPMTSATWKGLFGSLASRGVAITLIRDRDCLCCMQNAQQPHLAARSQCRWTWRDKCARLAIMAN